MFHHPFSHRSGEAERERNAEIQHGKGHQLFDKSVFDAEIEDRQKTAYDDDIDDTHGNDFTFGAKISELSYLCKFNKVRRS